MKPTASLCFALGMRHRQSLLLAWGLGASALTRRPPPLKASGTLSLSLFLPASGICQIVLAPGPPPPPPPVCYRAFGGIVEILFPPEVPFQGLQVTISLSLPLPGIRNVKRDKTPNLSGLATLPRPARDLLTLASATIEVEAV